MFSVYLKCRTHKVLLTILFFDSRWRICEVKSESESVSEHGESYLVFFSGFFSSRRFFGI